MLGTEQLFHIKKPIIAMLHPDALKMLCFINPESDRNPDTRPLSEIARSTIFKAHRTACASVPTPPVRM